MRTPEPGGGCGTPWATETEAPTLEDDRSGCSPPPHPPQAGRALYQGDPPGLWFLQWERKSHGGHPAPPGLCDASQEAQWGLTS